MTDNLRRDHAIAFGELRAEYGLAAIDYVRRAVELCLSGEADAMLTAPSTRRPIPAGSFTMGAGSEPLPKNIIDGVGVMSARLPNGDFDTLPAHQVQLTRPFAIATTQVTVEQYRQFDPTYKANAAHPTYATDECCKTPAAPIFRACLLLRLGILRQLQQAGKRMPVIPRFPKPSQPAPPDKASRSAQSCSSR
jgi:hypothetical protein